VGEDLSRSTIFFLATRASRWRKERKRRDTEKKEKQEEAAASLVLLPRMVFDHTDTKKPRRREKGKGKSGRRRKDGVHVLYSRRLAAFCRGKEKREKEKREKRGY